MRSLQFALVAVVAALAGGVGCNWMKNVNPSPRPTGQMPKVSAEQLVGYLNTQAGKIQTLSFDESQTTARKGVLSYTLRGSLTASQPRNFRMTGLGGAVGGKVDIGSNPEQFWVYVDAPASQSMFMYASHNDFENGRAKLPGGIPFEPDWVMQALGMTTYSPAGAYEVKPNERDRTYTLIWPTKAPNGMEIRKEVVFDADDATGSRPQVRRHAIKDAKGRPICSAEVKSAQTVAVGGGDPRSAGATAVQYPTHVVLRWEDEKVELDLSFRGAQVNQPIADAQAAKLFTRPNIPGATPIDLARYEFPAK